MSDTPIPAHQLDVDPPTQPGRRAQLAIAISHAKAALSRLEALADIPLTRPEREWLKGAEEHLEALERSMQQRREAGRQP